MKINLKTKSKKDTLLRYLSLINQLTKEKLTDLEISLMVEFALLPEKYKYAPFSSGAKNRIQEIFPDLTRINLNNKLYHITKKGFLKRDEDRVLYFPKYLSLALRELEEKKCISLEINIDEEKDKRSDSTSGENN